MQELIKTKNKENFEKIKERSSLSSPKTSKDAWKQPLANKERAAEIAKNNNIDGNVNDRAKDGLADDDANLMIKLKFLTYKLRTFLIRNGLSTLFKDGPSAYKAYYLRQMKIWGTSAGKQQRTQQDA
ncbi:hypothetical protein NC653_037136 [Populus alba x Populus x berolinensis]|uniref:Uncharacterized protein n=1 Tax=Populus alba x Populus x berolinensis TaxID=444605 RepID=A0AAD6LPE3_9ROSI|nr:hypothetical protein NC653_037136 [Populus alba x Populus x berolinensis]